MRKKIIRSLAICLCLSLMMSIATIAAAEGKTDGVTSDSFSKGDDALEPVRENLSESKSGSTEEKNGSETPVGSMDGKVLDSFQKDSERMPDPTKIKAGRSADTVRSIVGSGTQIINIDGLDVPLDSMPDGYIYIPFVDIPADAYYTAAVAWAYANDITAGVTELSFGPNQTCTRGQMVTFLWRAAGCPEPTGAASAFSDVTAGAYYEKAVAWAVANGITDGVGDGRFDPNGIVNRAQAVTFLYRAKGKPAATAAESFTDVANGAYYADAVAWAVANGITNGVGDNSFAPNANCVRGQTVTFLYRAYK